MKQVGLTEDRVKRSDKLFNKEAELSPERVKLLSNILGTIKKFPTDHSFYSPSDNTPECLVPYFTMCVYLSVQKLKLSEILKKIEVTNGAYSLFNILYEDTLVFNNQIINNQVSISIQYAGKEYVLGKDGLSVIEYYKGMEKKFDKEWGTTARFSSKMNHHLKTGIAENLGISYFMRAFRIPSNQWDKALNTLPLGKTAFPDFIVDTVQLDEEANDFIFSIIGTPRTRYILVDVKSAIDTTKSTNFGNMRLRYTPSGRITQFLEKIGVLKNGQKLFDRTPPNEFSPIVMNAEQFVELVKFFINDLYGQPEEYAAGKAGMSTHADVQKYLEGSEITILYEEVGANTGTHPFIYAPDILPNTTYYITKTSDIMYHIERDGITIAILHFYQGELAKLLPSEIKMDTSVENIEDKDSEETETTNKSTAIRKYFPIEDWIYMFKWNGGKNGGLRKLNLPPFETTYPRAKK